MMGCLYSFHEERYAYRIFCGETTCKVVTWRITENSIKVTLMEVGYDNGS